MTFTEFLEDVAEFCIKALKIAGIIILVLVVCFIAYKIISSIIKKKRLQKTIADIAQILYKHGDANKLDTAHPSLMTTLKSMEKVCSKK